MEYYNIETYRGGRTSRSSGRSGSWGRSGRWGRSNRSSVRIGSKGSFINRGRSSSVSSSGSSSSGRSSRSSSGSGSSRVSSTKNNSSPVIPKISGDSFRRSFDYHKSNKPSYSTKLSQKNKYSSDLYRQTSTTTTMGNTAGIVGFESGYNTFYPIEVIPSEIISINEYEEGMKKEKKNRNKMHRTKQELKQK